MNLVAESLVVAEGEPIGFLAGINIDPKTNQLSSLLVRNFQQPRMTIVVPASVVHSIVESEVRLTITPESCHAATQPQGRHGVQREQVRRQVDFGATLEAADGPVGNLRRVLYDQYSYELEELVIGTNERLDHEVAVPMAWISEIHRDRLVISATRDDVLTMPPAPEDR